MNPDQSPEHLPEWLARFCTDRELPPGYALDATRYFVPLAEQLVQRRNRLAENTPLLLAINGAQGSGKTTLAELLVVATRELAGWNAASISIDDMYLRSADRRALAERVHPLLVTRGVPGTHDLDLLDRLLDDVVEGAAVCLPRFDKARDDRAPESDWPRLEPPIDLLILEGWCVGVRPQRREQLSTPVNELESREDVDGCWRQFVNESIARYLPIWQRFNALVMLRVPGFEQVFEWRSRQERQLVRQRGSSTALSSPDAMRRFIQHYQRLTEWMLEDLPSQADWLFQLDADQHITATSACRA